MNIATTACLDTCVGPRSTRSGTCGPRDKICNVSLSSITESPLQVGPHQGYTHIYINTFGYIPPRPLVNFALEGQTLINTTTNLARDTNSMLTPPRLSPSSPSSLTLECHCSTPKAPPVLRIECLGMSTGSSGLCPEGQRADKARGHHAPHHRSAHRLSKATCPTTISTKKEIPDALDTWLSSGPVNSALSTTRGQVHGCASARGNALCRRQHSVPASPGADLSLAVVGQHTGAGLKNELYRPH